MYKYLDKVNDPQDVKKFNNEELKELCLDIRNFIIENINKTGGHMGSSLGAVEIAVALHKVYDAPRDKLVWDIGHQAYTHKIITGRKNRFHSIRQWEGLSGFCNPYESLYDEFVGGHSSTAISSAIGLKIGLENQNKDAEVVAIIGDAALSSGMSLEALNHLGVLDTKMIIILNDNDMSISKTEGALGKYLSRIKLSKGYEIAKILKDKALDKLPKTIKVVADKVESLTRNGSKANLFEDLGFNYIGPIDGHNIEELVDILTNLKQSKLKKPFLLHVITNKGKGHSDIELSEDCLHGVSGTNKIDAIEEEIANIKDAEKEIKDFIKEYKKTQIKEIAKANSNIFAQKLAKLALLDKGIMAVTAAMLKGTGLVDFQKEFPKQTFDVGIAEQHAVTFAAGLAKAGAKPFVCIYSTFMQRAYDQVFHDICLGSLPVRIVMDRAGFVGADGMTHHGILDYSMFIPMPNNIIMTPFCAEELEKMLDIMKEINDKPSFIRFSKNKLPKQSNYEKLGYKFDNNIKIGKGQIIQQGKDVAIIALGEIIHDIIGASEILKFKNDIIVTIADMRFAKPLDEELIKKIAQEYKYIMIIEEGLSSIFASTIMNYLIKENLLNKVKIKTLSIPEILIEQGEDFYQKQRAKLDIYSIYKEIRNFMQ